MLAIKLVIKTCGEVMIKRLKRDTGQFAFCQTSYQRLMALLAQRRFKRRCLPYILIRVRFLHNFPEN